MSSKVDIIGVFGKCHLIIIIKMHITCFGTFPLVIRANVISSCCSFLSPAGKIIIVIVNTIKPYDHSFVDPLQSTIFHKEKQMHNDTIPLKINVNDSIKMMQSLHCLEIQQDKQFADEYDRH